MIAQDKLNQTMLEKGRDRYLRQNDALTQQGALPKPQSKLMTNALPLVSLRLQADLELAQNEGKGRTAQWVLPVSLLDPDLVAYIGLNHAFFGVAHAHDIRKITKNIGQQIELEVWQHSIKAQDPRLHQRLLKLSSKHTSTMYKKKAFTATAGKAGYPYEPWSDETRVKVGSPILNAVLLATTVFETYDKQEGARMTRKLLGLTQEALEFIQGNNERWQWMLPVFLPTVEPPVPWSSQRTGCYADPRLSQLVPLVRTFDKAHQRMLDQAIKSGEAQPALDAINAIQSVPLRISKPILEAVKSCWKDGVTISKFPSKSLIPVPGKVANWEELDADERKLVRKNKEKIIVRNRSIEADILNMEQDLATAEEYADLGTFYLPYSLDFRGRVYPVPVFNHQRADHIRSLFEFSEGKPLGASGVWRLGIHLANCGDFGKISKKPLVDRYDWTVAHTEMICRIAEDPLGTREEWLAADKPFSFLRACLDWYGFVQEGQSFVSYLPGAVDGTNSGLQHYSAALRDEVGGKWVNLKSTPIPQDVYQEVADLVNESIEEDLKNNKDEVVVGLAKMWKEYGVSRKEVKRNVMTFAYSSEKFGFRQQLIEDLMKPLEDEVLSKQRVCHPFGEDNGRAAASYLAEKSWNAVNEVVSKAAEGMKFLQKAAALLAHESKPCVWTTPVGLPVLHKYEEWDVKRVSMFLHDRDVPVLKASTKDKVTDNGEVLKQVVVSMRTQPNGRINKDKQRNAVAPNAIHSLDAAHLMLSVLSAKKRGIDSFLLIHDSFATHMCDLDEFNTIIKQEFVRMYTEHDFFEEFYKRTLEALSPENRHKLPTPPEKGNLDIFEVLESDYAFS